MCTDSLQGMHMQVAALTAKQAGAGLEAADGCAEYCASLFGVQTSCFSCERAQSRQIAWCGQQGDSHLPSRL